MIEKHVADEGVWWKAERPNKWRGNRQSTRKKNFKIMIGKMIQNLGNMIEADK